MSQVKMSHGTYTNKSSREGEDGREVDAADRRDDASEGVEVRVADVEERL